MNDNDCEQVDCEYVVCEHILYAQYILMIIMQI